ncbi:hypothetical protein [Helicobacter suis]|nr:hypothetical protein [Helicobacter suis]
MRASSKMHLLALMFMCLVGVASARSHTSNAHTSSAHTNSANTGGGYEY